MVERAGLHWVPLGTLPPPEFPRFDLVDRADGRLRIIVYPVQPGHWLVEHTNGLWAWRWHLQSGGELPTDPGGSYRPTSSGIAREGSSRSSLIFPSHLAVPGCLWLRTAVDQNNIWQAQLEVIPN